MARFFNSSDHTSKAVISGISSIAAIVYPFTIAAWFRPIGSAMGGSVSDFIFASDYSSGGTANRHFGIFIDDGSSALNAFITNEFGDYDIIAPTGSNIRDGNWHTAAIVGRSSTDRTYFADASSQNSTLDRGRSNTGSLAADEIIFGTYLGGHGGKSHVAEACIWNVALTNNELAAYRAGVRPTLIRPASLVFYLPLTGIASPEPEFSGSRNNATLSGTPVLANHPPVSLFTRRQVIFAPYDVAGGGTSPLRFNSSLSGLGASGPFFHDRLAQ